MKINIGYSTKSIDKAIRQVEEYQKRLQNLIPTFIKQCADRIIRIANEKLNATGVDFGVIADIKNGWQPLKQIDKNTYILENSSEKAVYIEFGVGKIGKENPHDMASQDSYSYDINNHGNKGWGFISKSGEVDISKDNRLAEFDTKRGLLIRTAGQPASMFAFQAVMDFIDYHYYEEIWEQLIKGLG